MAIYQTCWLRTHQNIAFFPYWTFMEILCVGCVGYKFLHVWSPSNLFHIPYTILDSPLSIVIRICCIFSKFAIWYYSRCCIYRLWRHGFQLMRMVGFTKRIGMWPMFGFSPGLDRPWFIPVIIRVGCFALQSHWVWMKPRWLKPRSRVCRPAQVCIIICCSSFKTARIWVQIGLLFSLCWVYGLFIIWTWIFSMCRFVVLCSSWNTTKKGNPIFCDPICIGLFRDVLSNVFRWSLEFLVCFFYVQALVFCCRGCLCTFVFPTRACCTYAWFYCLPCFKTLKCC